MRQLAGVVFFVLVSAWMLPSALAAPGEQRKQELSVLKEQIRSLQDEIARGEESHDEIADSVSVADKAVSAAQRRLRDISAQRNLAEQDLRRLDSQRMQLEQTLADARKSLGDAIFRMYVEGGQAGARRFLSGDELNQLSRDAYYLEIIARQRILVIERSRSALHDLSGVIALTEARKAELVLLEKEHKNGQESLLVERKKQRDVLSQVSAQLRAQRKQMQTLLKDEGRIEKLLKGLERIARALPTKKLVSTPSASESTVTKGKRSVSSVAEPSEPVESLNVGFSGLKGRLRWPVKGELGARFGAARAEGGATWKGVFIRSSVGQDVKAIAAGKVAFADWLRGFGNLIIVDHGDGYMTVYGNNEALFKNPGDNVDVGESIASVGASGGLDESGLYFEVRYRGQAQDPAKWVSAK